MSRKRHSTRILCNWDAGFFVGTFSSTWVQVGPSWSGLHHLEEKHFESVPEFVRVRHQERNRKGPRMRMTDDDVRHVWVAYQKEPTEELRNQLIEKYLPLVRYTAERLLTTLPSFVECDDLQSMGIFGLMEAIDRFDLSRGVQFKTYCTNRIRGAILDELRSMDWVPRLVRIKASKIDKSVHRLEARLGRKPTYYELANELEMDFDEYYRMMEGASATMIISLSDEWNDGEDNTGNRKIDLIEDRGDRDPFLEMHKRDLKNLICRSLSRKEKIVIVLYYYEGLSMKEIAAVLGLTESRVCQIHSKVIGRLRSSLNRKRCELFY
jgi:RNA polymerase sigma factor for flagellar operon FliA